MPVINGGYYIKARCIQNSEIAHAPPHIREIWDWFLKEASFQGSQRTTRGQLVCCYKDIQEALHWKVGYRKEMYTKTNCQVAIRWLKKREMIDSKRVSDGLKITIFNYDYYQNPKNYEHSTRDTTNDTPNDTTNDTPNDTLESTTESISDNSEKPGIVGDNMVSEKNEIHNETDNGIHNESTRDPQEIHDESTPIYNKKEKKVKNGKNENIYPPMENDFVEIADDYKLNFSHVNLNANHQDPGFRSMVGIAFVKEGYCKSDFINIHKAAKENWLKGIPANCRWEVLYRSHNLESLLKISKIKKNTETSIKPKTRHQEYMDKKNIQTIVVTPEEV